MLLDRRSFLHGLSLGLAGAASADRRASPNFVVYVVDDLGSTDAGCYGNPVIRTPGLDMLAESGTRFTHAFCTTASCSASRSVILSGQHNHATGQYGHMHSFHHFISFADLKTLPVLLGEAGYHTVRAGKYHVAPESVYRFNEQVPSNGASPSEMAERCGSIFQRRDSSKPFLLYFCTTEPHRPFRRGGSDPVSADDVIVPPYLPDIAECREELALYYMSVQRADAGLLRLLELLRESGRWDDTVVVFVSDNGIAFPGAKTTLYEPGMRLPLVMRIPGLPEGRICDAMVSWADLAPTLLDLAGIPIDAGGFHGRSFRQAMLEDSPRGWDEVFASHTFHEITMYYPMRVIRDRKYKLIWNIAHGLSYPFASDLWASRTWRAVVDRGLETYGRRSVASYLHRPPFELYDLEADVHEVRNLADEPGHGSLLEAMKERLRAHQERTSDPWIVKWTYE